MAFPGLIHARHSLHVLTMPGIMSSVDDWMPTACNVFIMLVTGACHQRRCGLRNSRTIVALVPFLSALSEAATSNLAQSDAAEIVDPIALSSCVRLSWGTVSGPLVARLELLGSAGSDPGISSPAHKSLPSGSCACASRAGISVGCTAGSCGRFPLRREADVLSWASVCLHSPGT